MGTRGALAAIGAGFFVAFACSGEHERAKSTNDAGGSNAGSGDSDATVSGGTGAGSSSGGSGGTGAGGSGGSGGTGAAGSSGGSGGTGAGGSTGGSGGTMGTGAGRVVCLGAGGPTGPTGMCDRGEYCCSSQCRSEDLPCEGAAFHCDDAADCPEAFCCVTKISKRDGGAQVSVCRKSCDAETELVMCGHSGAPDDCPPGMECEITATLPPPYGYCCPPNTLCTTT